MDGIGIGKDPESDYVKQATTPNLNWLRENALYTELRAHGVAEGLPDDGDMGNSEMGRNAIGCGRVFGQVRLWLAKRLLGCDVCFRFGLARPHFQCEWQIVNRALYRTVFGWECPL